MSLIYSGQTESTGPGMWERFSTATINAADRRLLSLKYGQNHESKSIPGIEENDLTGSFHGSRIVRTL
jgi:hypothetical protein